MTRTRRHGLADLGVGSTAAMAAFLLALVATLVVLPAVASAATVSGAVKKGAGYQILLVQANGTAKKATIAGKSGAFSIRGVKLANASLQLVNADGSYYGPVVLKTSASKAFIFIRGAASLKLGPVTFKNGYALVAKARIGRYQTLAAYTAKAVRGKPIGAGRLGLVRTAQPIGLNGPGGDLDRDGIVNAFDIDTNGNGILNNVDRTARGASPPLPPNAQALAHAPITRDPAPTPSPSPSPTPPPGPGPAPASTGEFRIFSNFKLCDATSINADIPGISDIGALVTQYLPGTLTLATQIIGGHSATLDGLGNSYLTPHTIGDGETYPQVNFFPSSFTGTSLNLTDVGNSGDAQISPGADPNQIGSGDCFIETAPDGTSYAGTLNFVFVTAPALASYQFNTDAAPTVVPYDANGVAPFGMTPSSRILVPSGASSVTLTFWRPQRRALAGEVDNAIGAIDIGGLEYRVDIPNPAGPLEGPQDVGTHSAIGALANAAGNGVPVAVNPKSDGVIDPAIDAPASSTNTVCFSVSLPICFSNWPSFVSGTTFDFDIEAQSPYGDNAARKLYFVVQ
jgi:hypothetical protein